MVLTTKDGLWKGLIIAWIICLIPRIVFIVLSGGILETNYAFLQSNLVEYHYPLYQTVNSLLWTISFKQPLICLGLFLSIHAFVGPLVFLLSKLLNFPPTASWLSVFGVAFLPYYVSIAARQPQVGLTIVVFCAWVVVFVAWLKNGLSLRLGLILSIVSFALIMLRPNAMFTIGVLYLYSMYLILTGRKQGKTVVAREGIIRVSISIAVFILLCSAFTLVNYVSHGHLNLFTPNSGYNLYIGNNALVGEYIRRYDILSLEDIVRDHGLPPEALAETNLYKRDNILKKIAIEYATTNPVLTLKNSVLKYLRYWDFRMEDYEMNHLFWNLAYTIPYITMMIFAAAGIVFAFKQGQHSQLTILILVLASYSLPHAFFFGMIRMRMVTEFLLVMLAAYGLHSLTRKMTKTSVK
ncbi:MAG: hypothetical protein ABH851_01250 [Methanobacteriota archaeon]